MLSLLRAKEKERWRDGEMNTIGTFLGRNWTTHALNGYVECIKKKLLAKIVSRKCYVSSSVDEEKAKIGLQIQKGSKAEVQ